MAESSQLAASFTIAILAAGAAGAGLATMAARAGLIVVVEDLFPSNIRSLTGKLQSQPDWQFLRNRVSFSSTVEQAVRDADFVIDLVPDELESKLEIFSMLDRMAPPRTIVCSPMEATSISDLQACTYRAAQCIAVSKPHEQDWLPAPEIRLTSGSKTDASTVTIAREVWQRMGKRVISVCE